MHMRRKETGKRRLRKKARRKEQEGGKLNGRRRVSCMLEGKKAAKYVPGGKRRWKEGEMKNCTLNTEWP